jgi:hypothetical protein
MASKATKPNLHRETLRAYLQIINIAETLAQARTQLAGYHGLDPALPHNKVKSLYH